MGTLTDYANNIDYSFEYCEARRMMHDAKTDKDKLFDSVALLMLNCPDNFVNGFTALLEEIECRR